MKNFNKQLYLVAFTMMLFISCNNSESAKTAVKDSSAKKFDPAGEQKTTSTFDPKMTGTDTMYKNIDSVPK